MAGTTKLAFDTIYHIWNRGVNRATIFVTRENYRYFLQQYVKYIEPVATTYAYCLLPNHFHFVVRTRTAEDQIQYRRTIGEIGELHVREPSQAFPISVTAMYAHSITGIGAAVGSSKDVSAVSRLKMALIY